MKMLRSRPSASRSLGRGLMTRSKGGKAAAAAYVYRDPWLPSKEKMIAWRANAAARGIAETGSYEHWDRSVRNLYDVVQGNSSLRGYASEMIKSSHESESAISNVEEWCAAINFIIKTAPEWAEDGDLVGVPMAAMFTWMNPTYGGFAFTRSGKFNQAMADVLNKWRSFLSSPASTYVLNDGPAGWLSASAREQCKLDDYVLPSADAPHFYSWNDFFARHLKPGVRTVDADPSAVASSNDGHVFRWRDNVQLRDEFWLKAMEYSLEDMLSPRLAPEYAGSFEGGSVLQTFLNPTDFHRWWAPVDGVVRAVHTEPGHYYSKLETQGADFDGATTASCPYLTEVNCRGFVVIETAHMGDVCCMPIGMGEVSTLAYSVSEGQSVKKGDEIGYFLFGGSSFATIFEPQDRYGQKLVFDVSKDPELPSVGGGVGEAVLVGQRVAHIE